MVPFSFVLIRDRRLFMMLVLKFRLRSFEFGLWVLLLLSFTLQIFGPQGMEGLITGGSDDPHLDKLVMFTCEGLNEGIECRNPPSRGCEASLHGM